MFRGKIDSSSATWMTSTYMNVSTSRDGNLNIVVIQKSCVNKQPASWLQWTTNQKPGQQVDPTLDNDYNLISASVDCWK